MLRKLIRKMVNKNKDEPTKNDLLDSEIVGKYREIYLTRATDELVRERGQDGGTTTALLVHALEKGTVEAVVTSTTTTEAWKPEPVIVTDPDELIETAGSKYSISPNVSVLDRAIASYDSVALVGTPCQITAVKKSEVYPYGMTSVMDRVELTVGIFCTENFQYENLLKLLEDIEVSIENVERMDISRGKFVVKTEDGNERSVPVSELGGYANEACNYCTDLTAEDADISVGSIGAPDGWNIVLIRTKRGEKVFRSAVDDNVLEVKGIGEGDPNLLERLARDKRRRINTSVCATWRPYHPNIPL
ncbi:Coenzyme F420 hydrogenase/dehydrogenase, beta subunit C-terminal domain [Methanopyrus sp. KOL6]|uniref:Coenzyme F420 hydrogenase/dehydrogenase, beta subunit C-terminal domain n=1 Tax=Methanopyrus sp. KOL6 TaxID=1937004 RepID=UPI000B4BACFF|nr:Coenzyme F420 hydrogenase/dehydrogenase, beta subunit C-terminal domain [Methanopyrus sp. KOL6]